MSEELLRMMKMIPAGRRKVVKMGDRYLVYLPTALNEVWQYIHERKEKVEVYIILKKGDSSE